MRRIPFLLAALFVIQLAWQMEVRREDARKTNLSSPPRIVALRLASLDESAMASRYLMLYLQSFDIQPGIVVPYRDLDYGTVEKWLKTSLKLDERDPYPLFAASYIYTSANEKEKKRRMLDFIYGEFLKDPKDRWPWLARGYLVTKYELHDLSLAAKYSAELQEEAGVPNWVGEMTVFTLENMGELERAKILIGGMLSGGRITDPNEVAFLKKELERIKSR